MNNQETQIQEEKVDLKGLFFRYYSHWYYFVISLFVFGLIALAYIRYTTPVYSVSSTILIRDDNNTQLGAENILEGMELFSGKTNINNEIVVLKSYSLINQVIDELSLGVSYHQHGFLQSNELYQNTPFSVIVDSNYSQITNTEFRIKIIDDKKFNLSCSIDDQNTYNLKSDKLNKNIFANIEIDDEFNFNQQIKTKYFSFKISKTKAFNLNSIIENEKDFSFKLYQRSKLVANYIDAVAINPINKETSVLKLKINGENPGKNIEFLNTLSKKYIDYGLNDKNNMAINTISFIEEQLRLIKDSLLVIENNIEKFKRKHPNIENIEEEYGAFFQKQKVENLLAEQNVNIKYYSSLLNYLNENKDESGIVSPSSMGISNPELNTLINQLLQLTARKSDLELTTTEKNPTYISIITQIKNTKEILIENLSNLISNTKIYENDLLKRQDNYNNSINSLPQYQKEYINLKREYLYNEQTLAYLQNKKYEASLAKAGTESDHKVIDYARLDSEIPVSPKSSVTYFFCLLLGLFIPIIFISLKEFFNNTIRSKKDLQMHSNIPILGLIGHSEKLTSLIVPKNSKSVISESFRSIRTNIQYLAVDKTKKVITVTSSIGGEGKTFCSMNLASIFALSGHKTVLIGADLRKPKLELEFKSENKSGLSNYLINKSTLSEITNKTEVEHLDIIFSGPTPPNPAELLDSSKMKNLIKELNKKYDYVIIDTPPIGLVTDGVILMKNADINLYVVRHNYTKHQALAVVNSLYDNNQIHNLHFIINDYQNNMGNYGYGYGYGYGY